MTATESVLLSGLIFPESILHSPWFAILAAFVAINTVVYSALAVAKVLPKIYPNDWIGRRFRRAESRGISPEPLSQRTEGAGTTPRTTRNRLGEAADPSQQPGQ